MTALSQFLQPFVRIFGSKTINPSANLDLTTFFPTSQILGHLGSFSGNDTFVIDVAGTYRISVNAETSGTISASATMRLNPAGINSTLASTQTTSIPGISTSAVYPLVVGDEIIFNMASADGGATATYYITFQKIGP